VRSFVLFAATGRDQGIRARIRRASYHCTRRQPMPPKLPNIHTVPNSQHPQYLRSGGCPCSGTRSSQPGMSDPAPALLLVIVSSPLTVMRVGNLTESESTVHFQQCNSEWRNVKPLYRNDMLGVWKRTNKARSRTNEARSRTNDRKARESMKTYLTVDKEIGKHVLDWEPVLRCNHGAQ
jgi:hypothetical protein